MKRPIWHNDEETRTIESIKGGDAGDLIFVGKKVTLDDVANRCDWAPDTWHDVQTSHVRAQVLLYKSS